MRALPVPSKRPPSNGPTYFVHPVTVLLGEDGLLVDDTTMPAVVIDCSTVSTDSSAAIRQACHERGVEFLAAPVSGNAKVIKAGGLTIAVSGPEDTYLKVAHLLDHIAKSEFWCTPYPTR